MIPGVGHASVLVGLGLTVYAAVAFVLAGHIPQPGEVLEHPSGWRLEVTEGDTRRVTRLRLHAPEEGAIGE